MCSHGMNMAALQNGLFGAISTHSARDGNRAQRKWFLFDCNEIAWIGMGSNSDVYTVYIMTIRVMILLSANSIGKPETPAGTFEATRCVREVFALAGVK